MLFRSDEQRSLLNDIKDSLEKAEHRITLLEHWREELRGKTAAWSAFISVVTGILTSLAVHYLSK